MFEATHDGWKMIAYKHIPYPPFLDCTCICSKKRNNTVFMFNEEGRTIEEAIDKCRKRLTKKHL